MDSFGKRLLALRSKLGLTQAQFATQICLSRVQVTNLENDKRSPSDITISMICTEFGVNEAWLRSGDGDMFAKPLATADAKANDCLQQIMNAMLPTCKTYAELQGTFSNSELVRMYNYLNHRAAQRKTNPQSVLQLKQLFEVAFPDYEQTSADLQKAVETAAAPPYIQEVMRDGLSPQLHEVTKEGISPQLYTEKLMAHGKERLKAASTELPISGLAAAGNPLFSQCDDELISVPAKYCDGQYFVVKAKGDSMEPHISSGDCVVVLHSAAPSDGELALVRVDGETFDGEYAIKRFYQHGDHVELCSYNPDYPPMFFAMANILSAERIVDIIPRNE